MKCDFTFDIPVSIPITNNTNTAAMLINWALHRAEAPNILYVQIFEQQANVTKFLMLCKVELQMLLDMYHCICAGEQTIELLI
jgi:hypothetical protein